MALRKEEKAHSVSLHRMVFLVLLTIIWIYIWGKQNIFMVNRNGIAVLAYFFGIIGGVAVYLLSEKKDRYVRFHALQSILFNLGAGAVWVFLFMTSFPLGMMSSLSGPVLAGWGIGMAVYGILLFIAWIVLMVKAWEGKKYKLPLIGDLAESWTR
jgi:uncharacterized membrane protein